MITMKDVISGAVVEGIHDTVKNYPEMKAYSDELKDQGLYGAEYVLKMGIKAAPHYAGVAILAVGGAAACGASYGESAKRLGIMTAAYLTEKEKREKYIEKTKEILGDKKEGKIREALAKDEIDKCESPNREVIMGDGTELFRDMETGKYFMCTSERIHKAFNMLNSRMMSEMWVSIEEFYELLDLDPPGCGGYLGWHVDNGAIKYDLQYENAPNGGPCCCLSYDYEVDPSVHGGRC